MTYTEQSDTFQGGAEDIVDYAVSKGLKFGVFWGYGGSQQYAERANGKLWIDAYCLPNGASESGAVITEQVYDETRDALLAQIADYFGVRPLAMSYGYGNDSYSDYAIQDFLACRNSGKAGGTTYGVGYGNPGDIAYSNAAYKSKQSTSRWYDDAKADSSFTSRLQTLAADVAATKLNGGWYNNFTHWHNVIADGNLQAYNDYIDLLAQLNQDGEIYFAGYGEAVAYLVYRQMITRAVMYSPRRQRDTRLVIRLEVDNGLGVDTSLLQIPVSIRFSTTGTPLEGQIIQSDCNLISLGSDDYIVEVPYTGRFPYAIIYK